MKNNESEKKLRARLFTELVKEQGVDPTRMAPGQWIELYAELGRRVAAARKERAMYGTPDTEMQTADPEIRRRMQKIRERTLPPDFVNPYVGDKRTTGVYFAYLPDALDYCLSELGRVDILFLSAISGKSPADVIDGLSGRIYQDPALWGECFYRGFVEADEYLTGNLGQKLALVRQVNSRYDGWFADNVEALEQALPPNRAIDEIYVSLGSPFVMPWMIDQFICHLLGGKLYSRSEPDFIPVEFRVSYDPASATWYIPEKGRYRHSSRSIRTWGTPRLEALHILERTLNGRTAQVFDEGPSGRTVNRAETLLACEKQRQMQEEFADWVWRDEHRARLIRNIYHERYARIVPRRFDGSNLTLRGLSGGVTLYPYQRDAVARMLASPAVLLAHDVGSGKTYEMIAAAVELRRMGIAKKPMFVVPNHIVGQWVSIFKEMKPDARLYAVDPKNFTPKKRGKTISELKEGDFDGIVIPYSCFEMISLSPECRKERLTRELAALTEQIRRYPKVSTRAKGKERKIREELVEIDGLIASPEKREIYFDELAVDALFVDEAHNFKNYPIDTKCEGLLGINRVGSAKCVDLMQKVRQIRHAGGRVVFATGTPITNSISDVYVMQLYLQGEELERIGLSHFDAWTGMFAEKSGDFEIDVTTRCYRIATRFRIFHNLPELTAMLSDLADFHSMDHSPELPDFEGYTDCYKEKSPELSEYLTQLSERADRVRSGGVDRSEDNLLKITTDGRKAALDLRLVQPDADFQPDCRAALCAENVVKIWQEGAAERLTQLIFCDSSVPKPEFNLYDEMRRLLTEQGIPAEEIAFVHDYEGDKQRDYLFDAVNRGEIRVLLGSTQKLGIGVNVQERLAAVHHLDLPWRPADLTQREGRILRRGNRNERVQIFRYIVGGSFDAYSWQLLEIKQRFISALLEGNLKERDGEEIDSVVLDYAEIKALAVGNPLLRKRVEAANEIYRLNALVARYRENRAREEKRLSELPELIEKLHGRIGGVVHDIAKVNAEPAPGGSEQKAIGETVLAALSAWVGESSEREFCNYRGFKVVLPAGMQKDKPFLWLCGEERYYVEIGKSPVGLIRRLEHRLSTLTGVLIEFNNRVEQAGQEMLDLQASLAAADPYTPRLHRVEDRLRAIDRMLGIE